MITVRPVRDAVSGDSFWVYPEADVRQLLGQMEARLRATLAPEDDRPELTEHAGDLILSEDGTVVECVDVGGRIIFAASGCMVTRSRVRGSTPGPLVSEVDGESDNTIVGCRIVPDGRAPGGVGVAGAVAVRGCDIQGVEWGVVMAGGDGSVVDTVVRSLVADVSSGVPSGGGIRVDGGGRHVISGCKILTGPRQEAGVAVTQVDGPVSGVVIVGNVLEGSRTPVGIRVDGDPLPDPNISGNRIYGYGRPVSLPGDEPEGNEAAY